MHHHDHASGTQGRRRLPQGQQSPLARHIEATFEQHNIEPTSCQSPLAYTGERIGFMRGLAYQDLPSRDAFRQACSDTLNHTGIGINRHDPGSTGPQQFLRDHTGATATVGHHGAYQALAEVAQEVLVNLMRYLDVRPLIH